MKLVELLNAQPVLQRLVDRKMPAKLAYALAKNIKMVQGELETFNQTRLKLLNDNWKLNEKTNQYDIPDKDQSRWKAMYDELIQQEVGFEPYMIELSMLESQELTPGEIIAINWMIHETD